MDASTVTAEAFPRRSTRGVLAGLGAAQMIAVGAAAAIALVTLVATQSVGAVATAGIVWGPVAAAAFIPVKGRKLVEWVAVVAHFVGSRLSRQYRFEKRLLLPRPDGNLNLPGDAAALRLFVDPLVGAAMIRDPHARTLTAIARTHPRTQFLFLDEAEQERRSFAWARALAGIGRLEGVVRVQTLERTIAESGVGVSGWWRDWAQKAPEGSWARTQYEDLVGHAADSAERHETLLAVTVARSGAENLVRQAGGGTNGMAVVLGQAMRSVEMALHNVDVSVDAWLPRIELNQLIAGTYRPSRISDIEMHDLAGSEATNAPFTIVDEWDHLVIDDAFFQVWAVTAWPRIPAHAGFLRPVILLPGVRATWSMTYEPVATDRAISRAQREITAEATAAMERTKRGQVETPIHVQERTQAHQHLADVASGFSEMRFAGTITISAATMEELRLAGARVRSAAVEAQLEISIAYGQQAALFPTTALPIGRGM